MLHSTCPRFDRKYTLLHAITSVSVHSSSFLFLLVGAELDSKLEDWDGWEDDADEDEDIGPDHKHEEQHSAVEQFSLQHETDSSANRFGDHSSEAESSITEREDKDKGDIALSLSLSLRSIGS